METPQAIPYSHTCVDAGVDWMTATARTGDSRRAFETVGEAILTNATAAAVEIKAAAVRDYVGWRVPGAFVGTRPDDSIIILSGAYAPAHWKNVAQAATNVSRLDLQASVWTHGEQPALSRWYYQRVRRLPPKRGRPRSFSLIQSHPHGDTLYVGKRQSDYYGRIYDWSAAHKQGVARTVWRFEVEYKRQAALAHTRRLLGVDDPRTASEQLVHTWYAQRGIVPSWTPLDSRYSSGVFIERPDRDLLVWFQESLSVTIRKAINRHGLAVVLESLQLSGIVMPIPPKEDKAYDNDAARPLQSQAHRRTARATDRDRLSLQGSR